MAHFDLDELEQDEIFHALTGRKADLDARVKSLSEKDGLPEAAEAVRKRIELYMPSGEEGKNYRVGLVRLFAPQRDIDAERQAARDMGEQRDANGGQDLFGGGAETGGGKPAGQTEKAKRGRKSKDETQESGGPGAEPTSLDDTTAQAIADPVALALEQLDAMAFDLIKGDRLVPAEIYRGYALPVLELLPKTNPAIEMEVLTAMVNGDMAEMEDNAHALGYFIQRNVDAIREAREKPIGRREEAHGSEPDTDAIEGTASTDPALKDVHADPHNSEDAGESSQVERFDTGSDAHSDAAPEAGAVRDGLSFASPESSAPSTSGSRKKKK